MRSKKKTQIQKEKGKMLPKLFAELKVQLKIPSLEGEQKITTTKNC